MNSVLFKEYLEFQPDLFNNILGHFYLDDDEIEVKQNKDGTKNYIFNTHVGDYIDSKLIDPLDTQTAVYIMAYAFNHSDDLAKVLEYANREDTITFLTSNNGVITIPVDDVYSNAKFLERQERFDRENYNRLQNESLSKYLKRAKVIFNESLNK